MKDITPLDMHIQNCLVGPYYPIGGLWRDWIGDFEPRTAPNTEQLGLIESCPKIYQSSDLFVPPKKINNQVWFNQEDGGLLFELEVPRYSKDEISVSIEDSGAKTLVVLGEKKAGESSRCFTERFDIPNPQNLDLENCLAKVEDGLLSIAFPKKFFAPKIIKVL